MLCGKLETKTYIQLSRLLHMMHTLTNYIHCCFTSQHLFVDIDFYVVSSSFRNTYVDIDFYVVCQKKMMKFFVEVEVGQLGITGPLHSFKTETEILHVSGTASYGRNYISKHTVWDTALGI